MKVTRLRLVAAAGSGVLLAAARPPLDLGPVALVALVPLFVAWRGAAPRAAAGYAWVAGVAYHALLLSWAWYFGAIAIVPFAAVMAAYWAAAGGLIAWFGRHDLRGPVVTPAITAVVWVCAEALVARWPLGGFSWGEVGVAWHDVPGVRDLAGVGGVALVSFATVAANAFIAELVVAARARRAADGPRAPARSSLRRASAGLAALVVGAALVVAVQPRTTGSGPFRVAVLQGNDKNRDLTAAEERARYLPKSHFDLARRVHDPVDLIVFPESSMDDDPRVDPFLGDQLAELARRHDAWVLANAVVDADPEGNRASNLNVLYGPDGTVEGTYAKRHLVPFGEYIPFRGLLAPRIGALDRVPRDFEAGDRRGLFTIAGRPVATVICFESAFGYQVRPLVRAGAEVIVVSTNNRSYRRSANSAQHVDFAQMRAVETGRPVVHAAISGISALVDANGDVQTRTDLFDRTVVEATVAARRGTTLYVRLGEWVAIGSVLAIAGCSALVCFRARRRRSVDSAPMGDSDGFEGIAGSVRQTAAAAEIPAPTGDRA